MLFGNNLLRSLENLNLLNEDFFSVVDFTVLDYIDSWPENAGESLPALKSLKLQGMKNLENNSLPTGVLFLT